jgi:hypothetical protein
VASTPYGAIIGADRKSATGQLLSGNNIVFHNNFVNNTHQVRNDYTVYGTDFWDNGSEGNYWSDYTGNDTNADGIGDTPYIIDENRKDNFPLMFPYDIENNTIIRPSAETSSVPPEPFPATPVAVASIATAAVVGVVLLFYFKKRKR